MAAPYEPAAAEVAAYVSRMLAGLHELAEPHRELAMLAYILKTAEQEAEARARDASGR